MRKKTTSVLPEETGKRRKKRAHYRELRWEKLDNTAHLFPVIASEQMSNVYRSGYRTKAVVLTVMGILSIISIDILIGYRGWSVDYAFPGAILLMDAGIILCIIINRRGWQSYIMLELGMVLCSLIPILLNLFELERNPFMAWTPLTVSALLFAGTMILGGRRAETEIKRRFHFN